MVEDISYSEVIKTLVKSIKVVLHYSKAYPILICIKAVIDGVLAPFLLVIMQKAINSIQTKNGDFREIAILFLIYFSLKICTDFLATQYTVYLAKFQSYFSKEIEMKIYKKISSMDVEDFENPEIYDVLRRTQSQRGETIISFFNEFIDIFREIISSVGMFIILINFNYYIVVIVAMIPLIQYFFTIKISKEQYKLIMSRTAKERKSWYIDFLFTTGNAFKEIKLFNSSEYLMDKFSKIKNLIIRQDIGIARKQSNTNFVFSSLESIFSFGIYTYIGFNTFFSKILIGDMTTYISTIDSIKESVTLCLQSFGTITQNSYYVRLLFSFLEREQDFTSRLPNTNSEINNIQSIEFRNVSYRYLGSDQYALKNVSFTIKRGEVLGIVGQNGSGKSTLIKIMMGFYRHYEGDIFINSINLKKIEMKSYQKQISSVFQDFVKYELSVRENIIISDTSKLSDEDDITELINEVNLDPSCYENDTKTVIGRWFNGTELSNGQWQKIAIARALYREFSILLMDESDAALDAISQKEILTLIQKIFEKRIGVYVSHKVSHIGQIATIVLVLKDGEMVELDTPKNLLAVKGLYYELYQNCIHD